MGLLKCCLCFKPSNKFPDHFKAVLTEFRQSFNKFQSCSLNDIKVDKLIHCKSCWIYFMRIHQLDHDLGTKKETFDAKRVLLSTKIRQSQRSRADKGNNLVSCEDLEMQSSASKDNDDKDCNVNEQTVAGDTTETISCSLNKTDESDNELLESCETTTVITTDNVPISPTLPEQVPPKGTSHDTSDSNSESRQPKPTKLIETVSISTISLEEEPTEVTTDDTSETISESEPAEAKPDKFIFTYENKWLPKNFSLPKFSFVVKQISTTGFLFMNKYPFQGTEFGFKCGLCRVVSPFAACKRSTPWANLVKHIKNWHLGDQDASKTKSTPQRCIQVGPNRFQYGMFSFEMVDGMYQCGECGVLRQPAKSSVYKTSNILQHILDHHHEKKPTQYVCEYCGLVYSNRDRLRCHKLTKHENQNGQFPCSECGKNFSSRSRAASHRYQIHFKRRNFMCESCGKIFTQKKNLEIHVASIHKKEKTECVDCGKIFGSQSALKVHRYSHRGKKYSCDICGMDFTQGYSVTRHKKTAHNV